tara:strand:- start:307 stop:666 length:360 start_codon:yes stop_codon:yes gene_type:complete
MGGGKSLSPAQKKKDAAIIKAEEARRKRQKDNLTKDAAKSYYSSVKDYKGKAGGMNTKSKSYAEKRADVKKAEYRADARDAARSGQTMKQLKTSGKLSNLKVQLNKIKKTIEQISRGRK